MPHTMRDNPKLYFDIWRKAQFKKLIRAYVKSFEQYDKQKIRYGFAEELDKYAEGGRGTYDSSVKDWHSAYTISRELAIYLETPGNQFELSPLAQDYLDSKITSAQYLANYLLNFNQMIQGEVVHPFKLVLRLFDSPSDVVTKSQVENILEFNLRSTTEKNRRQIVNILWNRIYESDLLLNAGTRSIHLTVGSKYKLEDMRSACREYPGTVEQFAAMDHNKYVKMICEPNQLIKGRG